MRIIKHLVEQQQNKAAAVEQNCNELNVSPEIVSNPF
jgi:hypothetical protein